jgi:hypothetical protein
MHGLGEPRHELVQMSYILTITRLCTDLVHKIMHNHEIMHPTQVIQITATLIIARSLSRTHVSEMKQKGAMGRFDVSC